MGMTAFYGDFDRTESEAESQATIARALELGVNFLDTAWIYQHWKTTPPLANEELIGRAIARHGRERFIIATKFGIVVPLGTAGGGKPETVRSQLADSLRRLGTDYIDLYYMHRMDPSTPIEETMTCLKELVAEGKVRYIGLSECSVSELRRAHAVHPVSAIQMEWSLQSRSIELEIVPVARELGIGIVAYSPLGRGLLSQTEGTAPEQLGESDYRRSLPRFAAGNFETNQARLAQFREVAARKGCTCAQLALAWVHAQGEDVFPIPGTKSRRRLEENAAAALLALTPAECAELAALVPAPEGARYGEVGMAVAHEARRA